MKKVIISATLVLLVITGVVIFLSFSLGATSVSGDISSVGRMMLFRYGIVKSIAPKDERFIFEYNCFRGCHSRDVIDRANHTPFEWAAVVDRMRNVNNVQLKDNEAAVIIRHLQTTRLPLVSSLSSDIVHKMFKQLWKSDFGEGDVYIDVVYSPPEYFKATGALSLLERFKADEYLVFLINLTVHTGRLAPYRMDELAVLMDDKGREIRPVEGWEIIFETGDNHHREGIIRFPKKDSSGNLIIDKDTKSFELIIKDVARIKQRVFRWELPIKYPEGV
ncbi:MAG: hypothetical protein HY034_06045 [Nitrospirae bacterium]|nr:hypothetical protein [Nitrospirota bacterium]